MLPRQCAPLQEAGRHRRSSDWKVSFAAELLPASDLVPIPVRCDDNVLYSRSGEDVGFVSRLDGDADLPACLQKSCVALARSRLGELARDVSPNAHAVMDIPFHEAG